jgi:IclR family acetate operon transcriptional repressor
MRMFTEVGRRVLPHCTAVGKALLATMPPPKVGELLQRTGLPGYTQNTITDADAFVEALEQIAAQGYAVDEGEQEVGVRCVAVAVEGIPSRLALSISGPATRMTDAVIERAVPLLTKAQAALAAELA